MAISIVVAVLTWRLWQANLRVPIFAASGDAAWTLVTVKDILQHGWYESNPNLGAPFGQLSYDFPAYVGELGKVLMVKVLGLVFSNPAVVMNVISLGGFAIAALPAFLVLRALRFARGVSLVGSVLFATSPIHFVLASAQAWLAIYAGIPLSAYLILAVLGDTPLLSRRQGGRGSKLTIWMSRRTIATLAMCLVIGLMGLNYAEFTCILLGIGAIVMAAILRRPRMLLTGAVLIVVIAAPVIGSAIPDLAYRAAHGANPVVAHRVPVESYEYALQPVQLLLPQIDDRIPPFAHFTERIDADLSGGAPGIPSALGQQISVGLVSAVGLVWLMWALLAGALGKRDREPLAVRTAVATLLAILLGMSSGGSTLFAYVITATIQVWARIAILIAFFAVVGLALLLERMTRAPRRRHGGRWLAGSLLGLVLLAGLLEGTTNRFVPAYPKLTKDWTDDARFVAEIQRGLPTGAMVLELPYVSYPEAELPAGLTSYEPLVPYLHSNSLRWSAGAMAGRATDWMASWAREPTDELVDGAVAAGFRGVYVSHRGYADGGASVMAAIRALTGVSPSKDADGSAAFFNLESYAARLRAEIPAAQLTELARATIYPARLGYATGFYEVEPGVGSPRWAGRVDVFELENPSKSDQTVSFSTVAVTGQLTGSLVQVTWPDGERTSTVATSRGVTLRNTFRLPPGTSRIRVSTNAPRVVAPRDPRVLYLHFGHTALTPAAYSRLPPSAAKSVPIDNDESP